MEHPNKIVDFMFCKICKHYDKTDAEHPCDECLLQPVNQNSYRPVYYVEDRERIAKLNKK